MPLNKRANINGRIIYSSLNKAVQTKDEAYATMIARFARSTVTGNAIAAQKAYDLRMLEYYERVDDRPKYFMTTVPYYDNYVMTISVDSIHAIDNATRDKLVSTAKKDTIKTENGFKVKSTVMLSPSAQRYAWSLKEGAWNFYQKTSDAALLAKATQWIKRANEFLETPESLDVYARLLYKQNQKELAVTTEQQAIELKKKQKYSVKENEETLALMQKGLSLND